MLGEFKRAVVLHEEYAFIEGHKICIHGLITLSLVHLGVFRVDFSQRKLVQSEHKFYFLAPQVFLSETVPSEFDLIEIGSDFEFEEAIQSSSHLYQDISGVLLV